MTMGAPTKYMPEMCDKVLEFGRLGYHVSQMARDFNVDRLTVYRWAEAHPDFCNALMRAKNDSLAFWLEFGQKKIESQHFKEKTYELLIRNKCELPELERRKIKALHNCATHNDQMVVIREMLAAGKLSILEAKTLAEVVAISAKVDEVTELRKIVERLEKETD